jgi:hypothetical protein
MVLSSDCMAVAAMMATVMIAFWVLADAVGWAPAVASDIPMLVTQFRRRALKAASGPA